MIKKFLAFLLIFTLLLPGLSFAQNSNSIDIHIDGDSVSITVKGESYSPVSIVIEDDSRKHYIDQKQTDSDGKAVFYTVLEEGKEYKCTVNINGILKVKDIFLEKDEGDPELPEEPDVAYIYIKGYKGVILSKTEVDLEEGDTVLSLTKRVLNSKGIDYKIRGGYVVSIDNQEEFDKGPDSGWMFSINGDFPNVGPSNVKVSRGDYIKWLYTTDLGEDIGNAYKDPNEDVIDNALDLLDDEDISEEEIIEILKDVGDYLEDAAADIKNKSDLKTVLDNIQDANILFLKALKRLETEDGFEDGVKNSLKIGKVAVKLLDHTDSETVIDEIFFAAKENTGITLELVNEIDDEDSLEKIVEDMLDLTIEINSKMFAKQKDSNIKPEQRFAAVFHQGDDGSVDIKLPAVLLSKSIEKGITKLDLESEILNVVVPFDAINEIHRKQGLELTAKKVDESALPGSVQGEISDESIVIDISEASKQNFQKPIEAGIPFAGTYNNEQAVAVFLLDENGSVQPVGGIYDPILKKARFYTTHFSKYFAKESVVDFGDVRNHWAKNEIGILAGKGIVKGKAEGIFEPDVNITRAEFVALITRALGYEKGSQNRIPFADVAEKDWYYDAVAAAYNNGLVKGKSAKEFDPNGNITRQEMAKIIADILENKFYKPESLDELKKFKDFEQIALWARESAALCLREKVINGIAEDKFAPQENATRAQAAAVILRLFEVM